MRHLLALFIVGIGVSFSAGCALRSGETGSPSVTSGPEPRGESLESHIERVRYLSSRPAVKISAPSNVEQWDRELAALLLQLSGVETAERHRLVAERYRTLRVPDAAYRHFSRAVALNPQDAAAHDGLARVWRDWGLPHLALGDSHRAIFHAPTSAAAHNTMGTVLQALGQREHARKAYERASGLDATAVYALSNLCYLSFLDGDFNRALGTCRAALAVDPEFMAARNNLALAHAAAGRFDLARAEFMDAGDGATGSFNMGIIHMAVRDYAGAAAAFDAASAANPLMNIARERAAHARELGRAASRSIGDPK